MTALFSLDSHTSEPQPPQGTLVMFSNPIVKTTLTVLGVIIVLKIASPWTAKIPVVGKWLAI